MFSPDPTGSCRPSQNNRDHRKICVIDGKVGFTGGINLVDEYINRKERFGHWKDTAVMFKGDAVQSLTMMFLQMWNVAELDKPEDYRTISDTEGQRDSNRNWIMLFRMQTVHMIDENVGEEVYFHILNHAKKYVHIMTPYLILDNEMITYIDPCSKKRNRSNHYYAAYSG